MNNNLDMYKFLNGDLKDSDFNSVISSMLKVFYKDFIGDDSFNRENIYELFPFLDNPYKPFLSGPGQ